MHISNSIDNHQEAIERYEKAEMSIKAMHKELHITRDKLQNA